MLIVIGEVVLFVCSYFFLVDKRMDEWVGIDRFLSTEQAPDLDEPSSHDGPMTRNQRRKIHDHGIPVRHT